MKLKQCAFLSLVIGSLLLTGCGRKTAVGIAGSATAQPPAAAQDKAPAQQPPGESFAFPSDKTGKSLAESLRPNDRGPTAEPPSVKRPLPAPPQLAKPEPPLPANRSALVRPPLGHAPVRLLPRPLPEAAPFTNYRGEVDGPNRSPLPSAEGVRLPSVDVNQPAPLPTLATPLPDRVPLDDPTVDASTRAALAAVPPSRVNPAPFVRLNLPDPFEHRETVKVRTPPVEDPTTSTTAPAPPRP